jgi:hypothetical protein
VLRGGVRLKEARGGVKAARRAASHFVRRSAA